jgi:hypothetical protein
MNENWTVEHAEDPEEHIGEPVVVDHETGEVRKREADDGSTSTDEEFDPTKD